MDTTRQICVDCGDPLINQNEQKGWKELCWKNTILSNFTVNSNNRFLETLKRIEFNLGLNYEILRHITGRSVHYFFRDTSFYVDKVSELGIPLKGQLINLSIEKTDIINGDPDAATEYEKYTRLVFDLNVPGRINHQVQNFLYIKYVFYHFKIKCDGHEKCENDDGVVIKPEYPINQPALKTKEDNVDVEIGSGNGKKETLNIQTQFSQQTAFHKAVQNSQSFVGGIIKPSGKSIFLVFNRQLSKIPIDKDPNSSYYKNLNDTVTKSPEQVQVKEKSELTKTVEKVGLTSIAIIIRYFQIVDLLTNFFSKLNLETPEKIKEIQNRLKQLDFPKIGFLESMSLTDDGGMEAADKYKDSDKKQYSSDDGIRMDREEQLQEDRSDQRLMSQRTTEEENLGSKSTKSYSSMNPKHGEIVPGKNSSQNILNNQAME